MTEITLGGSDDEGGEADPGGGSGMDLNSMLDQLEEVQQRLEQNPQLAQMFGLDLPDFNDEQPADEQDADEYPPLNAANLLEIANALEQHGAADMSVSDLKARIESNPEQINSMIRQNG